MKWWITSRRPAVLALGFVGSVLGVTFVGGVDVPAPSLLQGQLLSAPLAVFLPLGAVIAAVWSISNTPAEIEIAQVRRPARYDAVLLASLAALTILFCGAAAMYWGDGVPLQGGRNLVGYLGISVFALALGGSAHAATFVPAAAAVVAVTFGRSAEGGSNWWAWPLAPGHEAGALAVAVGIFVGAITTSVVFGRRAP